MAEITTKLDFKKKFRGVVVRIILDMGQRPNFVIQGGFKLPIGYRFHPTDEELVVHYLKRKVFSIPFPASVIPEFDVFQTDPWGLPGL